MNSNDPSELLDLERGLPTTGRDVDALRALRYPENDRRPVRALPRGPSGARSRVACRQARTAGRSVFPLSGRRVALECVAMRGGLGTSATDHTLEFGRYAGVAEW